MELLGVVFLAFLIEDATATEASWNSARLHLFANEPNVQVHRIQPTLPHAIKLDSTDAADFQWMHGLQWQPQYGSVHALIDSLTAPDTF